MAAECGEAIADVSLSLARRLTDAEANMVLERAATRLRLIMFSRGVPQTETVLDGMAEAFNTRLTALRLSEVAP